MVQPTTLSKSKKPVVISIKKRQKEKKPSPIKYPTGSDHCDQSEDEDVPLSMLRQQETPQPDTRAPKRQDLRVRLNKLSRHSTLPLINDKGPVRSRLRPDPWLPWKPGCAPKSNRDPQPFLEGQAPNCPEVPRGNWNQEGNRENSWFNPDFCTSDEEDKDDITTDELGTAESSKEEKEDN